MPKLLGIDYGAKRIGIATSDDDGRIAFPRITLAHHGDDATIRAIKAYVKLESIIEIVVGLPIALNGRATEQTAEVRTFAEKLEDRVGIPVILEQELLTTKISKESGVDPSRIDAAAAAITLQSYLDRTNARKHNAANDD